jgi:predicted unusual protein kinase regulating ubiquinone biosynthesis (AarF/ABC1/UbiB family)
VHRANYQGQAVAVKVQYPGITEALESDLKMMSRFARVGLMLSNLDGKALAAELSERIFEECDYAREAENQMLFHRLLAKDEFRRVPRVIAERSSPRVLTSEFDTGMRFRTFVDEAPQEVRDRAGEIIFETCFTSIFRDCVFNADPHPGNYLFGETGDITFLDFGCLKWFSTELIEQWKAVARSLLDDDKDAFAQALTEAGMIAKPKGFDWDYQWHAMDTLYTPFKSKEPTIFTGDFIGKANAMTMFDNPNKMKLTITRDWLFVNRLQFGMLSVLARLGSRGDWGTLFRTAVEMPTSPLQKTPSS